MNYVQIYTFVLFLLYFFLTVAFAKDESLRKEVTNLVINYLIYLPLVGRVFNWW